MEINILNKEGMLTKEERKEPLEHTVGWCTFKSNLDLSDGVIVTSHSQAVTYQAYSRDLASFIVWWSYTVLKDLNGFSGFQSIDFEVKFFIER